MDNCPKCGYPTKIDYDMEEEPYLYCPNCDWFEVKEEVENAPGYISK